MPRATSSASCRACARSSERAAELANVDALVLPLHGSLDVDAQERALAPATRRKVILATNIAETSLTVEGVTDVIDSGLHKVLRFDPETAVDHLVAERIAADSAEQRAGRAGRTRAGPRDPALGRARHPPPASRARHRAASISRRRCSTSSPGAAIRARSTGSSGRPPIGSTPR